jgi:NADPH-dependent curcumin reductase CurA
MEAMPGPRNIIQVVGKSLTIRGFIVSEFASLRPQFLADMTGWIADGKLKWEETVFDGVAKAPDAFIGLFSGGNTGKMLVRL